MTLQPVQFSVIAKLLTKQDNRIVVPTKCHFGKFQNERGVVFLVV